jgi:hypothetical protein
MNGRNEFEKYRVIQDKLFESDYDRFIASLKKLEESVKRKGNHWNKEVFDKVMEQAENFKKWEH